MRIGIVGAGAIGGWIGVRLAAAGHAVSVLARGETLEALRAGPWRLEIGGETLAAPVSANDDAVALGVQDILVIALKGPALTALAPAVRAMIGPDTVVVPAMNGVPWWFLLGGGGKLPSIALVSVDPEGAIAAAIPFDAVLGCVVHASAAVAAPGHVVHKAGNRLILGRPSQDRDERHNKAAQAFSDAGFDIELSDRIQQDIWYKLWGNMTMNPISAFTGATSDRVLDDPLVVDFILRVMDEARTIGARIGAPIAESGKDRILVTRQLGAFKTSMLQDAEAGRPLELDQLVAAPREIAGRLGLATPNLDALFGLSRLFARSHGLYPVAD
jgi:2-dehydropantoate 2-reductase